ncbi:hypothetical protein BOVA514_2870 [Bacteroides ovatus]|nr:hypothetical protein BOVA514_2870 [Bacteroides ovatus]
MSTGVKVYPDQWNIKKQEAYISCRLTESDNINNSSFSKFNLLISDCKI